MWICCFKIPLRSDEYHYCMYVCVASTVCWYRWIHLNVHSCVGGNVVHVICQMHCLCMSHILTGYMWCDFWPQPEENVAVLACCQSSVVYQRWEDTASIYEFFKMSTLAKTWFCAWTFFKYMQLSNMEMMLAIRLQWQEWLNAVYIRKSYL